MGSLSPFCSIQGHIEQSIPEKRTYEQIDNIGSIDIKILQQQNDLHTANKARKQVVRQSAKTPPGVSDVQCLEEEKVIQLVRRELSQHLKSILVGEEPNYGALVKNEKLEERGNNATKDSLREQKDLIMVKSVEVVEVSEVERRKCAPSPGYVGDGSQLKFCKICGQPEDANKTVICDGCEEVFHLSCCRPPVSIKYFLKKEFWFCYPCEKQNRQTDSEKHHMKTRSSGVISATPEKNPKKVVRIGPAYQADIPLWTGSTQRDQHFCSADCPASEEPCSQEEKENEEDEILQRFEENVRSASKLLPGGTLENWIRCKAMLREEYKDCQGHKHAKVICGKWRRVPLDFKNSRDKEWECFNGMEWNPMHADCAVPQEIPTEEVMVRIQWKANSAPSKKKQVVKSKKQVCDPASKDQEPPMEVGENDCEEKQVKRLRLRLRLGIDEGART